VNRLDLDGASNEYRLADYYPKYLRRKGSGELRCITTSDSDIECIGWSSCPTKR